MYSARRSLGWLLQVVTAAILVLAVLSHLIRVHLSGSYHGLPTYDDVASSFKNPLVVAEELILLAAALYHALYGLHTVLVEASLVREEKSKTIFTILGVILFAYALLLTLYIAIKL